MKADGSALSPARSALHNENGVVLLIVLIVVTLLTIIITEFTYNVQLDMHRTRNALNALQAALLARSAINIEESFLMMDKNEQGNYDAFTEDWWLALQQFCSEATDLGPTMKMQCALEDESGKLNINLTRMTVASQQQEQGERKTRDAFARDALRRIFEAQNIEVDIVDQLQEYWLQEPSTDEEGRQQRVPDFQSLEDFAARFRIPTPALRELRRVLTAAPTRYLRAVNANTAPGMVLAAIINESNAVAAILERQQSEEPFKSAGELRSILDQEGVEDAGIVSGLFVVNSNMFRLRASARTNVDPEGESPGGIGQTLSELVWRQAGRCPPDQTPPCWTLKPLDWQKEGGAALMEYLPENDMEPGSEEDYIGLEDTAPGR